LHFAADVHESLAPAQPAHAEPSSKDVKHDSPAGQSESMEHR
jgi:hypothetical protein